MPTTQVPTARRDRPTAPEPVPSHAALGRRLLRLGWIGCLGLLVLLAPAACGPADEPREPAGAAGPSVTNEELGITLSQVPAGFDVARNEAAELMLERSAPEDPAHLEILVGPVQTAGVNLVDQVWEEKARIESLPGGDYRGQNELAGAAIGTVYTSRGRFVGEEGEAVEELRALAVHPGQNRLLILDYEYPPTEEKGKRLQELMQVIEVVEAASSGGGGDAGGGADGEGEES